MTHAQFVQIDQWLATGDGKRAEIQIARLLRSDLEPQERAELLLRRARARILSERPDEAIEDLQTAHALLPEWWEHSDVQELLGDAYFSRFEQAPIGFADRADAERAMECYRYITEHDPDYHNLGWIMYQWGRVLLSGDRVDEAVEKFKAALLKPSHFSRLTALCYERLGFISLVEKRDPAEALSFFSRAANTYPAGESTSWLTRLHLLRSRAFRELRDYEEALQAAQVALSISNPSDPDYRASLADAHLTIGEILSGIAGREREAIEHFLQFLQYWRRPQGVDVTWSRVHETLGDLWFRLERYAQAIVAYSTALTFNPYHPWEIAVYYQIARCHYRLREYEKAIATVEHMLRLADMEHQPITDYGVYGVLANAHFALEHYDDAWVAYRHAVELAPPQAENLDKLKTYLKFAEELARRR